MNIHILTALIIGALLGVQVGYDIGYNARKTEEARTALEGPEEGAFNPGPVLIYGSGGEYVALGPRYCALAPAFQPLPAPEAAPEGPFPVNPGSKFRGVLKEPWVPFSFRPEASK